MRFFQYSCSAYCYALNYFASFQIILENKNRLTYLFYLEQFGFGCYNRRTTVQFSRLLAHPGVAYL